MKSLPTKKLKLAYEMIIMGEELSDITILEAIKHEVHMEKGVKNGTI